MLITVRAERVNRMVTVLDLIDRLKSKSHLAQHNEQQ